MSLVRWTTVVSFLLVLVLFPFHGVLLDCSVEEGIGQLKLNLHSLLLSNGLLVDTQAMQVRQMIGQSARAR
jgi:hypothetical protein